MSSLLGAVDEDADEFARSIDDVRIGERDRVQPAVEVSPIGAEVQHRGRSRRARLGQGSLDVLPPLHEPPLVRSGLVRVALPILRPRRETGEQTEGKQPSHGNARPGVHVVLDFRTQLDRYVYDRPRPPGEATYPIGYGLRQRPPSFVTAAR